MTITTVTTTKTRTKSVYKSSNLRLLFAYLGVIMFGTMLIVFPFLINWPFFFQSLLLTMLFLSIAGSLVSAFIGVKESSVTEQIEETEEEIDEDDNDFEDEDDEEDEEDEEDDDDDEYLNENLEQDQEEIAQQAEKIQQESVSQAKNR